MEGGVRGGVCDEAVSVDARVVAPVGCLDEERERTVLEFVAHLSD